MLSFIAPVSHRFIEKLKFTNLTNLRSHRFAGSALGSARELYTACVGTGSSCQTELKATDRVHSF